MKVDQWINFFKQYTNKKLFSLSDINQLVNDTPANISIQLNRLIKSQVITRVAQRWYANPFNPPSLEEIAMVLRVPSYLSLEYALSRQGILSQHVYTLTLMTPTSPYTFQGTHATYEYHQIQKPLFTGYTQENNILIAIPEKALLDLIYIRGVKTKQFSLKRFESITQDMDLEAINSKLLKKYATLFGNNTQKIINHLNL